jgi:hypothetical protein
VIAAGTGPAAGAPLRIQPLRSRANQRRRIRHLLAANAITPAPEVAPATVSAALVMQTGHMWRW